MDYQWSLEALYKGYQDSKYQKDLSIYKNLSHEFSNYFKSMTQSQQSFKEGLQLLEKEYDFYYRLKMYSSLIGSVSSSLSLINSLTATHVSISRYPSFFSI